MNKNISADKLLSACIIIGIIIMIAYFIFSEIRKTEKQPSAPAGKEVIKERESYTKPGYAIPTNIFPTDEETKKNIKSQQEKQQVLDKSLAERKKVAIEVRKNVEAYLNKQPASTTQTIQSTGEPPPAAGQVAAKKAATSSSSGKRAADLALQKIRFEQLKRKELLIHH